MTPDQVKRKLAAILSADVQGYSRLMEADEEGTIRTLKAYMEVINGFIQQHRGRLVATGGDSVLAEFASVVDAVRCAVGIQEELKDRNKDVEKNHRMEFRIGVNLGDVVEEGDTILGDGVNIAARLEILSESGGICISGTAYDQVENKLSLGYEYLGEQTVKNIAKPVRVYRVLMEPEESGKLIGRKKASSRQRRKIAFRIAAILIVVIAVVTIWGLYVRTTSSFEVASKDKMAFPLPDKPSIAVLPFVNMSGDPKQEFFSDGITEDIITALSKIQKLFVIARNSTFTYKGKPTRVKQVSEELGVRYVLEGSVQRSGDRVRITAQLIDALNGHHLWSERYDRELKDLFAMQDEVTMKILVALQVKLTEGEQAVVYEKIFKGKQGLDCYLKVLEAGYYLSLYSAESNKTAQRIAEEIVTRWPENPQGYIFLGFAHYLDILLDPLTKSPKDSLERAMELAQKAKAIDDSAPSVHGLLSYLYSLKREYDKAISEGERAMALSPNGAIANEQYATSLYHAGRLEEAIPLFQKAIRLNPIGSWMAYNCLGVSYNIMGQFEEAVSALKQALLRNPDNIFPHLNLAYAYLQMGKEKEARAEAAEVLRVNPKFTLDDFAKASYSFKNQSQVNKYISLLRKAGLK
ncbi:MAG: tetratricopeptide repeat protein [Deltaproteobacteria bacterium]|nr:tetratricopeptide repeat protein [Deltaproteobacteria bacterium]